MRWRLNRLSLRTRLLGGFLAVICLSVIATIFVVGAQANATEALTTLKTESRIARLSAAAKVAMLQARQDEKDFLGRYKNLGFDEARCRYVTPLQAQIAQARYQLDEVRRLTGDPEVARQAQAIEEALLGYQGAFLTVVSWHQRLGYAGFGLEGRWRDRIHDVEAALGLTAREDGASTGLRPAQTELQQCVMDLLVVRAREKDYLLNGTQKQAEQWRQAVKRHG